ncbi:hypothetical protein BC826DRAFT_314258 [Russula brevipes]|nr:hypothetical protein BC826DRAFT_314258 [Russula brevipes]
MARMATPLALANAWGMCMTTPGCRATTYTPSPSQKRGYIRRRPTATPTPLALPNAWGGCIRCCPATALVGPENSRPPSAASDGPTLRSREALLQRRVFQYFTVLGITSVPEATQTTLLQSVISLVPSVEGFAGSSVQAAIALSLCGRR